MLILHRKPDEAVLLGGEVRVVVLRSDGGGVRLGIEAPSHISILREEILEQIRAENLRASSLASELVPPDRGRPAEGDL
jgi:carbon storage regulator